MKKGMSIVLQSTLGNFDDYNGPLSGGEEVYKQKCQKRELKKF